MTTTTSTVRTADGTLLHVEVDEGAAAGAGSGTPRSTSSAVTSASSWTLSPPRARWSCSVVDEALLRLLDRAREQRAA